MVGALRKLGKRSRTLRRARDAYVGLRFRRQLPLWALRRPGRAFAFAAAQPYTALDPPRQLKLYRLADSLAHERLDGAIVECGVFMGGSSGLMGWATRSEPRRPVWLLDSWEGLPEPGEEDRAIDGVTPYEGMCATPRETVEQLLFEKLELDPARFVFVQGWFEETLPTVAARVGEIALLHIDADWYASVKLCLEHLYDLVVPGGYIVIDDYGQWEGCRKAVDEFLAGRLQEARTLLSGYYRLEDPQRFDPESSEQRVEVELEDGTLLRGFVDRIDVAPTGELRVVDYSGRYLRKPAEREVASAPRA